jgi:hypothetical protein
MKIEKINEKMDAIRTAESCISTILTINPNAVDQKVFVLLAELKLDLLDILDEQYEAKLKEAVR